MSAQLQSPTQQPPPINLAPLKPLQELQRGGKKPSTYLADVLKKKFQHYHSKDRDVFREIVNVGQLIALFCNGKHYPVWLPFGGGSWGFLPNRNVNDDRRALNVMNNLKQNLLTKWMNANPDILIRAARNLDKCQSAAKSADTIHNYYERQFYTADYSENEGIEGMTFGTYIYRIRFDDQKQSMSVIADIFEQKNVSWGEGYGFCADCEYQGKAAEFQSRQCPRCQSGAVDVQTAPSGSIQSIAGQQRYQVGDLVCEPMPMAACRWNLAKRPEESSYLIYRQRIPRGAITQILGNVLLPDAKLDDHGLEVLHALHKQGSAVSGRSAFGDRRTRDEIDKGDAITFDEMWLSPEDYADVDLMGNEETVSGESIPKGKLTDIFPDGLCAVGLNGMAIVLALYAEKHKDHVVSGTWFKQSHTGAGRGIGDAVEVQKQFNVGNNQAREYMAATYTPAIGYDDQIWTGSKMKYLANPRTIIPFKLTKLPEGRKLADSIYQFQPTAMPNQFFNYFQDFLGLMFQKTSMVTDYASGEPGITGRNDTATAAEIDQSNADAINQPIFMTKGEARKRGAEITINLFRKHFPMKRYFDLGGKYGRQQGVELSAADIQADLLFEVVKNSEMPMGPFTRRKNRVQFFNILGGAEGYMMLRQADPKLTNEIEREFDIDLETDDYDAVNELCLRRLGQMQQAFKMGVTDPMLLIQAIRPPISRVEKELDKKADWFASWLSEDEGQEAPMEIRVACEMLAMGQFEGSVNQAATLALGEGAVIAGQQAPTIMAESAANQPPPESQEPDATAMLQAEQEAAAYAAEADEAAKDRAHELKMIEAEGQRDMKVSSHDAQQKIKIEKSKPRPVVKPATKKK